MRAPVPLFFYSDHEDKPGDDTWVVESVLKHEVRSRKGKKKIFWYVKWKSHDHCTWEPASQFVHNINDIWVKYNKRHNVTTDAAKALEGTV